MRVVAGALRGRRLRSVPGRTTRPTTERARSALFDWLGPIIGEARVLDLFAGTGAIGIEAISRGASHATFVERDRQARGILRENLEALELVSLTRVLGLEVERAVRRLVGEGERFELVFADAPHGEGWTARLLSEEAAPALLPPGGTLVVELDVREAVPEATGSLVLRESKRYGDTRFDRYELRAEMEG
jgi:16S rRNA (guanine(966)-N(2))-methyltransferase RsmD